MLAGYSSKGSKGSGPHKSLREPDTLAYDFPCSPLTLLRVANAMQHNVGLGDRWGKWVVKQMAARTTAGGAHFLFCWRAKGLSSSSLLCLNSHCPEQEGCTNLMC